VSNVIQLFREAAFGPEMTEVMGEAFERATRSLPGEQDPIKEVIAKRILDAVRRGIRDPRDLCLEATRGLGLGSNGCD
jgi:hypothetical protein